jgi:hypothetical protein
VAVGRLTGVWLYQVLRDEYPNGVLRRGLLEAFAALLVKPRSSRGAKGRLAWRLYRKLTMLQRRGLISVEDGVVRAQERPKRAPGADVPLLTRPLERKLFRALLADDGLGDGHGAAGLHAARWDFLASCVEAGWTMEQGAAMLGLSSGAARTILSRSPTKPAGHALSDFGGS